MAATEFILLAVLLHSGLDLSLNTAHEQQPEQVHLSYGDVPTEMWVTWVTMGYTNASIVRYGQTDFVQTANGTVTKFRDGGIHHRTMYIHRAKMTHLHPGQKYVYSVGGNGNWSEQFEFRAIREGTNWSPRIIAFGDMGYTKAWILPHLKQEIEEENVDVMLHIGDLAYDLHSDNAKVGDEFMREIEPVASHVPYMTCPGNHEPAYNFSNYRNRFTMPGGDGTGMYYSWNIGNVHILSFNTEVYHHHATHDNIKRHYDWLEADLREANRPENRSVRPWIVTMGHRPMYCSTDDISCTSHLNPLRHGSSAFRPNLEDLFYNYGVDVELYAHEHEYERLWPVYKFELCKGSTAEPYTDPKAPVHIITGSGGDREGQTPLRPKWGRTTAFRTADYGFTAIEFVNQTHMHLLQTSTNKGGKIIDEMWLIKTKHGVGLYDCL